MTSSFRNTLTVCLLVTVALGLNCTRQFSMTGRVDSYPNVKVQFVDSRVGWIAGPRLLGTADGGRTWKVLRESGDGTVRAPYIFSAGKGIRFIDPNTGWMLKGNNIIRTRDGGRTWPDIFSLPISQDSPHGPFFFISTEEGWIISEHIYHTTDGGRSWQQLAELPRGDMSRWNRMNISSDYLYSPAISFTDPKHGVIAHLNGELYLTNDGGKSWEMVWQIDKQVSDLFFVDQQHGWVVGLEGFAARTVDGGRTWMTTPTQTKDHFHSVFFINKQMGWMAGGSGTILYSKDGGLNWQKALLKNISSPPPIASVSFADELHGYAVGGNGTEGFSSKPSNIVLTTEDGGQTWRVIEL